MVAAAQPATLLSTSSNANPIPLRFSKLDQASTMRLFMFKLADTLPATVRGFQIPSGSFIDNYSRFLNKLLLLNRNPSSFRNLVKETLGNNLAVSDSSIKSSLFVSELLFKNAACKFYHL